MKRKSVAQLSEELQKLRADFEEHKELHKVYNNILSVILTKYGKTLSVLKMRLVKLIRK